MRVPSMVDVYVGGEEASGSQPPRRFYDLVINYHVHK